MRTWVPELIVVVNLLLLNLQSGKWNEIFLLSVEGMSGKETKDFIGIEGAILRGVAHLLGGGGGRRWSLGRWM